MKRLLKYSSLSSFVFSFLFTLGYSTARHATAFKFNFIFFLILLFVLFVFNFIVFKYFEKIKNFTNKIKLPEIIEKLFFRADKSSFINCFLVIFISYFLVLLAYFPGLFNYDVLFQANFFVNHDYIEIHPIFHSFLIYITFLYGAHIKSGTVAMFTYSAIQMGIMALIFSYCIFVLSKYKVNSIVKFLSLIFFALHPINRLFSIVATKDVMFSGLVLLFCLFLFEKMQDEKFNPVFITLCACFIFLFRHNGYIAYVLILPFLIFKFRFDKKTIAYLLIPVVFYVSFGFIKKAYNIKPAPIASSIGIPLQQTGRVRKYHDSELSYQDKMDFRNIVSKEKELEYFPYLVDCIKIDSSMLHSDFIEQSIRNNPLRAVKLYLKWAKLYPKDYVDAFLMHSLRYWYPFCSYQIYSEHYFIDTIHHWDNIYGVDIIPKCFNHPLKKKFDSIFLNNSFEKNPITYILYNMAFNLWFLILGYLMLLYQKKYNMILILSIIPMLMLTVFLGPIALLRYIYQNYVILPLLFAFLFSDFEKSS